LLIGNSVQAEVNGRAALSRWTGFVEFTLARGRPFKPAEDLMQTRDIARVLADSSASDWLKDAIRSSLVRDPVDAANDAEVLSQLLQRRADAILAGDLVRGTDSGRGVFSNNP
jgi:hypothetical protein